jgi:hypothetical protein
MHRTAAARALSGSAHAGTWATRSARATCRAAIENGASALNAPARAARAGRGRRRRRRGRAVNRARASLRHNHAARRRNGSSRRSDGFRFCNGGAGSFGSRSSCNRSRSGGSRGGRGRYGCRRRSNDRWPCGRGRGRNGNRASLSSRSSRGGRRCNRRPGNDGTGGRPGGDGRGLRRSRRHGRRRPSRRRRGDHNRRRWARLRDNAARSRLRLGSGGRGLCRRSGRGRTGCRSGRGRSGSRTRLNDGLRGPGRRRVRRSLLLFPFQNGFGYVADMVHLRPVDPGLRLGFVARPAGGAAAALQDMRADTLGFVRLDGTGVRFFLGHANRGESLEDFPALNLQFTR